MSTPDPLLSLMADDDARYLRVLINRLPEMERLVCRLRHFEELTVEDMSAVLMLTPERVEELVQAGVERLQAMASA